MGWNILCDETGEYDNACFICNTSGVAFGPLMDGRAEAENFAEWLMDDPRIYTADELTRKLIQFKQELTYAEKREDGQSEEGTGDNASVGTRRHRVVHGQNGSARDDGWVGDDD